MPSSSLSAFSRISSCAIVDFMWHFLTVGPLFIVYAAASKEAPLENRELCVPPGADKDQRHRYSLARSVVIRHLLVHLPESCPDVHVEIFPSLTSDEFHKYLDGAPVHFVMAHDGALSTTSTAATESAAEQRSKILLRNNIWWFNSHRLNVALINRIEFRDSKVIPSSLIVQRNMSFQNFGLL